MSTVQQLTAHLIAKFQLRCSLSIQIGNYSVFQDDKLQSLLQPDDVLQIYAAEQQKKAVIEQESSDEEEESIPRPVKSKKAAV